MGRFYQNPKVWALLLLALIPLGILLASQVRREQNKSSNNISKLDGKPGSCKVLEEKYCDKGKIVEVNGEFIGVGFSLPSQTPIFSDRVGVLTDSDYTVGGQSYDTASIVSEDNSYVAFVFNPFYVKAQNVPQVAGRENLKIGQEVGKITETKLTTLGNYNLLVVFGKEDSTDKNITFKNFNL